MSRFEEVINEAIGEVVLSESPFRAETLAQHIAELVRARQGAERAEVTIAARYPEHKPAPVSGVQTQEIYTLYGRAVAFEHGTRRMVGVSATGMTACPCAQELVAGRARSAWLAADGFSEEQIERILERVPVATHNQRGLATLHIGCIEECVAEIDASALLAIAEGSMSSEIYELMKRSDEVEVVEKAHRRPRFVEDCVREMIAGVVRALSRSWTARASSRRARRTSRRSTSTTSSPSATACSPSCAREIDSARPPRTRRASTSGSPPLGAGVASGALLPASGSAARAARLRLLHAPAQAEEVVKARENRHQDGQVEQRRDPQRLPVHGDDGEDRRDLQAGLDLAEHARGHHHARPGWRRDAAP